MSRPALSLLIAIAIAGESVFAQIDAKDSTPLVSKIFPHPSALASAPPYQVDNVDGTIRGPQQGYNICNKTTENQQSLCQTAYEDSIGDFCLWAPPTPNSTIGDSEGIEVAWCTKAGHGTRLIPADALFAVQLLVTSKYRQYSGFIDQTKVNLPADDDGGELDPHGADLRGNPIGGEVYTNAFSNDTNDFEQVHNWNLFLGGWAFCLTICDIRSSPEDQAAYCENRYDRMGCLYNMPANVQNGTFEVCDADLKTPVGIYTSGGATHTYTQPFTGTLDPFPYTAVPPKSSNCVTYQSSALYTDLPTLSTPGASPTGVTSSSSAKSSGATNSGSALGISFVAGILGTLFAIAFLS